MLSERVLRLASVLRRLRLAFAGYEYPKGNTTDAWKKRIADFYLINYLDGQLSHPAGPSNPRLMHLEHDLKPWARVASSVIVDKLSDDLYKAVRESLVGYVFGYAVDRDDPTDDFVKFNDEVLHLPKSEIRTHIDLYRIEKMTGMKVEDIALKFCEFIEHQTYIWLSKVGQRLGRGEKSWGLIDNVIDLEHAYRNVFAECSWYDDSIGKLIRLKAQTRADIRHLAEFASSSTRDVVRAYEFAKTGRSLEEHEESKEYEISQVIANPELIKEIKNPSEQMQLAVVKLDPDLIQHIKKPTESVQLEAIEHDSGAFDLIKNPSEKAKALYKKVMTYWPPED